ncbi:hypothetical protein D3C87_1728550 [compost metagenome]
MMTCKASFWLCCSPYLPLKPRHRHKYLNSSTSRYRGASIIMRDSTVKNFSPPQVSLWLMLSNERSAHGECAPHAVPITASSMKVHSA